MNPLILASFTSSLFGLLLSVMAIFLILLILVQRGRGGGLAGALGGMGGSSAFGAKAGDVFTRITFVAAAIWILLCIAAAKWGAAGGSRLNVTTRVGGAATGSAEPGKEGDASKPDSAPAGKSEAAPATGPAGETGAAPAATEPAEPASGAPAEAAPADAAPATPE